MRQRVDAFERVIKKARREDEKAKTLLTWKENFVLDQEDRELKAEKMLTHIAHAGARSTQGPWLVIDLWIRGGD